MIRVLCDIPLYKFGSDKDYISGKMTLETDSIRYDGNKLQYTVVLSSKFHNRVVEIETEITSEFGYSSACSRAREAVDKALERGYVSLDDYWKHHTKIVHVYSSDTNTSRSAEIFQEYLKSLGLRIEPIENEPDKQNSPKRSKKQKR